MIQHFTNYYQRLRRAKKNDGSVLILTIIISSVLFSIGISLASILQKETARQLYGVRSAEAIAIANTAFECALYNDFNRFAFFGASSQPVTQPLDCGDVHPVRSVGDWTTPYLPLLEDSTAIGTGRYTFVVLQPGSQTTLDITRDVSSLGDSRRPCAQVTLQRRCVLGTQTVGEETVCTEGIIESIIDVLGYAACAPGDREQRDVVRRFRVYY